MSSVPQRRLFSESEYLLIERQAKQKSEYVRGEMFAMAGANERHEIIAGNCFGLLWQELSKRGCGVYKSDMKVRVAATGRFTYPDVVAVCGERQFADEKKDVLLNPTLLIEVLSDSTADYDQGDKAHDYRLIEALREVLIVDQHRPLIEHFLRENEDTWKVTAIHGLATTIELKSVGCRLKTADIFHGIEFAAPSRPVLRVTDVEQGN